MAGTAGLAFGFVPHHVVQDLQDIGNWKVRAARRPQFGAWWHARTREVNTLHCMRSHCSQLRASAIDNLHRALRDVPERTSISGAALEEFVAFLCTLIADPNFKIAVSSTW